MKPLSGASVVPVQRPPVVFRGKTINGGDQLYLPVNYESKGTGCLFPMCSGCNYAQVNRGIRSGSEIYKIWIRLMYFFYSERLLTLISSRQVDLIGTGDLTEYKNKWLMWRSDMIRSIRKTVVAAAVVLSAASVTAASAADQLVVVGWGGATAKAFDNASYKPFSAETGINIVSEDYSGGLAEIKAQVDAGKVTWDVVDLELADAVRACSEGLLEDISHDTLSSAPDGTTARDDFFQGFLPECGVGTYVWATVLAYDTTRFPAGKGPRTIRDFFDIERFPGKRGLKKHARVNLEWALLADGVAREEVYEVLDTKAGKDRAFRKLDTIKPHVVWWTAGAQPPLLLADGEVVMTSAYNGRIYNAQVNENKPFDIVWDGQVFELDVWGIPRGTRNLENALKFVRYSTDTQRLAEFSKHITYGPARKSSNAAVDADIARQLPTSAGNISRGVMSDYEWWADNADELNERFNVWLARD